MTRDGGLIPGYEADIHMALHTRIMTNGVPRLWFIVWLVICLFAAFALFTKFHSWIAVVPLISWGIGHVALIAITRWDADWDSVLIYALRYRSRYDAG